MNRSIQSEGSFGNLKEGTGFRKFRYRGKTNVEAQNILLAIAHNQETASKIQSYKIRNNLLKKCYAIHTMPGSSARSRIAGSHPASIEVSPTYQGLKKKCP